MAFTYFLAQRSSASQGPRINNHLKHTPLKSGNRKAPKRKSRKRSFLYARRNI